MARNQRVVLNVGSGDDGQRHIGTVTDVTAGGGFTVVYDRRREAGNWIRGGRYTYRAYQAEAFTRL